ncbi:MAG: ribokinase [Terracidiphilus sp.]|jgi:ribokinase
MRKSIVVVGSLNLDLVASVNRLPALGETMIGRDFNTYGGGKGANQAVALARLGASVKMIGKLGTDAFAKQLRDEVEQAGVDTSCVGNAKGPSGTALITTSADGDNTIVVIAGANGMLLPEDIERYRPQIEEASIVLGQLEIPRETTEYLAKVVMAAGVPFLLDPAPAYPLSEELLQSVTWLTPNETEAQLLLAAHCSDASKLPAPESAERLLRLGVRNVILKLGARGVYLAGKDVEGTFVDAYHVHAVDTTAAGDAFNGAFAYALTQNAMAPQEAAGFACAVAALSVTRSGAQTSMPVLSECEAFLEQAKSKISA